MSHYLRLENKDYYVFYQKTGVILCVGFISLWSTTAIAQILDKPAPLLNLVKRMLVENPALQSANNDVKAASQQIQADSQPAINVSVFSQNIANVKII